MFDAVFITKGLVLALFVAWAFAAVCQFFYIRRMAKGGRKAHEETAASGETKESCGRMLPEELLALLKAKDFHDLKVGDQQYFSSVILDFNKADFSGVVQGKQVNEVFASINQMLGKALPAVSSHGGVAEGFAGGGLTALFFDQYEPALTAAVSIFENLHAMKGEDREYETVAAGICEGTVMIGVVGHGERMAVLTLSQAKEFAGFLRSIGYRYYARILVTEDFLRRIPDSAMKFNYRFLGSIRVLSSGDIKRIYDVFDGDIVEVRNRKRKTRMVFEKGVELFAQEKLLEARQHFIEVMKLDVADRAARSYLLRCDACLNGERRWQGYLETY